MLEQRIGLEGTCPGGITRTTTCQSPGNPVAKKKNGQDSVIARGEGRVSVILNRDAVVVGEICDDMHTARKKTHSLGVHI